MAIWQRFNVWTLTVGLGCLFVQPFPNVYMPTFQRLDPHGGVRVLSFNSTTTVSYKGTVT